MQQEKIKLIFFGTPEFAKIILDKLIVQDNCSILAVVTTPDKPVGRKKTLTPPLTKVLAIEKNIPVLQPNKLDDEFINNLKKYNADLFVVAAYGKIIPQSVLDIPPHGILNVHPSLLPKYRGASPVQAVLLNGDDETGVTIMKMDFKMDHGEIISNFKFQISNNEIYSSLSKKLAEKGADLLIQVIPDYVAGKIELQEQNHDDATFCKMIKKEDGQIDWNKTSEQIYNQYRAFHEWPGVYSNIKIQGYRNIKINFIEIKIADIKDLEHEPGQFFVDDKKLFIVCGSGTTLQILKLQPQGKNQMDASAFINGYLK